MVSELVVLAVVLARAMVAWSFSLAFFIWRRKSLVFSFCWDFFDLEELSLLLDFESGFVGVGGRVVGNGGGSEGCCGVAVGYGEVGACGQST